MNVLDKLNIDALATEVCQARNSQICGPRLQAALTESHCLPPVVEKLAASNSEHLLVPPGPPPSKHS